MDGKESAYYVHEIDQTVMELDKEPLGSGNFGCVYRGRLKTDHGSEKYTLVAVKMLKMQNSNGETYPPILQQLQETYPQILQQLKEAISEEIQIMSRIGYHENVLKLIGSMKTGDLPCLVSEYCSFGSLDKFLISRKDNFVDEIVQYSGRKRRTVYKAEVDGNWASLYEQRRTENIVTTSDLLSFSYQIANGMEFLHIKEVVHRDLALRNIFLAFDYIVKIGDFGLSRRTINGLYQKCQNPRLPVKWTAPEVFVNNTIPIESDLYTFGILLWELFTLGGMPHEQFVFVHEVEEEEINVVAKKGKRMDKPSLAPKEMYELMKLLCNLDPYLRPPLKQCKQNIIKNLKEACPPVETKMLAYHASAKNENFAIPQIQRKGKLRPQSLANENKDNQELIEKKQSSYIAKKYRRNRLLISTVVFIMFAAISAAAIILFQKDGSVGSLNDNFNVTSTMIPTEGTTSSASETRASISTVTTSLLITTTDQQKPESTSTVTSIIPKPTTISAETSTTAKATTTSTETSTTPKPTTTPTVTSTALKSTITSTETSTTPKPEPSFTVTSSKSKPTTTSPDTSSTLKATAASTESPTTMKLTATSADTSNTPKPATTSTEKSTTPELSTTSTTVKAGDLCPSFVQHPFSSSMLLGGEHFCPVTVGPDTCYSCCVSQNSVCCDDGSCMDYDPFCRYPESCCDEPYCGRQCCSSLYGEPCGPVCAPKDSYLCCDGSVGFMCAKPDFCCNSKVCCPQDTHCCETNACCNQDEQCCDDKCCLSGYHCCGTGGGHCCPDGSDCFSDGSCCPHGQACANVTNGCCAIGSTCSDDGNMCCMNYQTGCGNTCCDPGHVCCDGKCCPEQGGCIIDGCCPVERACGDANCCSNGSFCCPDSPTHHCCPYGEMCCNDHCCGAKTGYCGPNGECCKSGEKACGGTCCGANETCITADDHHPYDYCCAGVYCPQTGKCCQQGEFCNPDGYCCSAGSIFCSGGAMTACYSDPYTLCCKNGGVGDGTACTAQDSKCVSTPGTQGNLAHKVCCPSNSSMVCANMCLEITSDCQCCGVEGNCCYSPYSCQANGTCMHIYTTDGPWWCWDCGTLRIGPSCCNTHYDQQPPIPKVPATPRGGATRSVFYAGSSQLFLSAIKTTVKPHKQMEHETKIRDAYNAKGSGKSSQKQKVTLPPPPTQKISPSSYACFSNKTILNSTCEAWICLEEIANCGVFGYLDRMFELYCKVFGQFGNLFNTAGAEFLVCASNCYTSEHVSLFKKTGFKLCCASLENWGYQKERNVCMISCNFCGVYLSNIVGFKALFDFVSPGVTATDIYHGLCGFK